MAARPSIGLVSPGAMGSALGRRLVENGARVLTSLRERSAESAARATDAGMESADDDELVRAQVILSVVPPSEASRLAERFAKAIRQSPHAAPIYVDCNAVSVETMKRVSSIVGEAGARCLDGCIIGPPPAAGKAGPRLYVSGEGAEALRFLGALGLDLRILDGACGAASALKMCYAGINKGLIAVATAMILAAARSGADASLCRELAESRPDLLARFAKALPDMFPKASRWSGEMHEIASFLGEQTPEAMIYEGMAGLYERLGRETVHASEEIAAVEAFLSMVRGER